MRVSKLKRLLQPFEHFPLPVTRFWEVAPRLLDFDLEPADLGPAADLDLHCPRPSLWPRA